VTLFTPFSALSVPALYEYPSSIHSKILFSIQQCVCSSYRATCKVNARNSPCLQDQLRCESEYGEDVWEFLGNKIFTCRMEKRQCQLDVALYSELVEPIAAAALFPVNELRNMATLAARSQLLLYVDGDLLMDQTWTKSFREEPAKCVPHFDL